MDLSAQDLENIHTLIEKRFGVRAGVRDRSTLDVAANRPNQEVFGTILFPDIFMKAASLMEAIVCWQPFIDANKRTGLVATSAYLYVNGYSLILPLSSVRFSVILAMNRSGDQTTNERVLKNVARWLRAHSARTGTSEGLVKLMIHVIWPARTIKWLLRLKLERLAWKILYRWLAIDIYPHYRKEAGTMLDFWLSLLDSSVKKRPLSHDLLEKFLSE